jgi:hypothetical protein
VPEEVEAREEVDATVVWVTEETDEVVEEDVAVVEDEVTVEVVV